ncbi:calcium-binding protein [Cupriavidus metallidurans]|uniref:calcium-binding protein n=1 Tax=Cupriavidus metallidurans TaxID=119219 RepID=UPI003D708032
MAWYCHLEDSLSFPFEARVRQAMVASPLRSGDRVSVFRLAHDQLCRVAIFVHALYNQRELVVPLAQLVPVRADQSTHLAVSDWHYWHDHGCSFCPPHDLTSPGIIPERNLQGARAVIRSSRTLPALAWSGAGGRFALFGGWAEIAYQ